MKKSLWLLIVLLLAACSSSGNNTSITTLGVPGQPTLVFVYTEG